MTTRLPHNSLSPELASRFARAALGHVAREFPNKLDHVLSSAADARTPKALHPIFFGSFDWHSSVHAHWLLATLLRQFPELPEAGAIRELLDAKITEENVAGEVAYLRRPESRGFERPYGWAWALMLAAELEEHRIGGSPWAEILSPLTEVFCARFLDFLPKATYPIRTGAHYNTAFAVSLALEYAGAVAHDALATRLRAKAIEWYAEDAGCQAWEPGGDEFLSPALMEAECMRRVLPPREHDAWLRRFLPRIASHQPATLFSPVTVSDRSDGKIAHLDGLNLSRAWCWRSLASGWPAEDERRAIALEAAESHLSASLPHVTGDYAGEHWLATFAVLALRA